MTSNLGATDIARSICFAGTDLDQLNELNQAKINKAVKDHFKPEFLNRIDETIAFNALSTESIARIFDVEVMKIRRQMLVNKRQPQHFVFKTRSLRPAEPQKPRAGAGEFRTHPHFENRIRCTLPAPIGGAQCPCEGPPVAQWHWHPVRNGVVLESSLCS